jgi:hypothetical protein
VALLVPFRPFRASRIAATGFTALLLAASAPAQQSPPPKSNAAALDLAQAAEAKSAEWSTLAAGMEQRVARLLPCDARVRAAVEEVSRASDVRFTALIAYWQDAAAESQEQATAANKLLADYDARVAAAKADSADAEKERAYVSQQFLDVRKSAAQQWALSDAVNELGPIALAKRDAAVRAVEREKLAEQSKAGLTEIASTAEARQRAIEKERQALTTEGNRWREYYAARITRAQIECQLTGAATAAPAPRPPAGKKGN